MAACCYFGCGAARLVGEKKAKARVKCAPLRPARSSSVGAKFQLSCVGLSANRKRLSLVSGSLARSLARSLSGCQPCSSPPELAPNIQRTKNFRLEGKIKNHSPEAERAAPEVAQLRAFVDNKTSTFLPHTHWPAGRPTYTQNFQQENCTLAAGP